MNQLQAGLVAADAATDSDTLESHTNRYNQSIRDPMSKL